MLIHPVSDLVQKQEAESRSLEVGGLYEFNMVSWKFRLIKEPGSIGRALCEVINYVGDVLI